MKGVGIEQTAKMFNETIIKDVSLSYKNELGEIIIRNGKAVLLTGKGIVKFTAIFEEE